MRSATKLQAAGKTRGGLFLLWILALATLLTAAPHAGRADATGSITGVVVTTSASSVSTIEGRAATFGASVTSGTVTPDHECEVTGGPYYTWSSNCSPVDQAETTGSASFPTKGSHPVKVTCTVSYDLYNDYDGSTATISASDSETVTVNVGVLWDADPPIGSDKKQGPGGQVLDPPQFEDKAKVTVTPPGATTTTDPVLIFPGKTAACGLTGAVDYDHYVDNGKDVYAADSLTPKTWTCSGGAFVVGTNPDNSPELASSFTGDAPSWVAPDASGYYTISCTLDDTPMPVNSPDEGTRDDDARTVYATVAVVSVSVLVRRTGATQSDGNGGTEPADFTSSATVAAGGQDSDEHKGDVEIHVSMPDGTPAPAGLALDASAKIISGGQGPTDGTVSASISLGNNLVTDGNGDVLCPKAFLSGCRTDPTTFQLDFGDGSGPSASFNQVWNDSSNAWTFDPDVYVEEASPVIFAPSFSDGTTVPITHHSLLKFIVTAITGEELDPVTETYSTVTYTADDISGMTGDPAKQALLQGLVSFTTPQETDGHYSSEMTVHYNPSTRPDLLPSLIVDTIEFDAIDFNAFDANGSL